MTPDIVAQSIIAAAMLWAALNPHKPTMKAAS